MATATTELAARLYPDTTYRSQIVDPLPEYPHYTGMLGASLVSGPLTLAFAYGYETPATIHAAVARLRDALDRLDIDVDAATEAQDEMASVAS
jgi:hypothetical protein